MRIDVALIPAQRHDVEGSLCLVVDVLRASSTIVAALERGAARVVPAPGIEAARRLRERLPDHLLCGEEGGLPPPGFDLGNSPRELASADLAGRGVILATSNGTRVLHQVERSPAVLVGSLLNRRAAAAAALEAARERGLGITVVCSGAYDGVVFALEDALAAGAIVDAALGLDPALEPSDAARLARWAFLSARGDLAAAVASAYHARDLSELGLGDDVEYCARLDASSVVPRLEREEGGVLVLMG